MQSVSSAAPVSARTTPEPEAATNLAQKPLVRWVLLLLPTAVVLGPMASIPPYSGGLLTLYRLLYLPAAVFCYIIWHQHGKPRIVGSRALLIFTALVAVMGTIELLAPSITSRGTTDHFILVTSLLMAWLIAAAASCDADLRNTLLTGWYVGYMVAAALAVMHALGIFVPQTATNILGEAYAAVGRQFGFAGTLGNPNDLAAFALAGAPIAYLAARRWDRPWLTRMVFIAAVAMGMVSLSRSALFGLLLMPLAFTAFRRSGTPGRLPVLLAMGIYATLVLITFNATRLWTILSNVPYLGNIVDEVNSGGFGTDNARLTTWTGMIRESLFVHPWGVGPGQYEAVADDAGFALVSNAHNVFLEVLFEYGLIVGIAGLVWMVLVLVKTWQSARLATTDWDNLVVSAGATALLGLILWGVLTSTLITRPPWALMLGTGLALISSVALTPRDNNTT